MCFCYNCATYLPLPVSNNAYKSIHAYLSLSMRIVSEASSKFRTTLLTAFYLYFMLNKCQP